MKLDDIRIKVVDSNGKPKKVRLDPEAIDKIESQCLSHLIRQLPPYIHLPEEANNLYFVLTTEITGKWQVAYETEGRFYHAITKSTPEQAIKQLIKELNNE